MYYIIKDEINLLVFYTFKHLNMFKFASGIMKFRKYLF